jgi:hypothetical protein
MAQGIRGVAEHLSKPLGKKSHAHYVARKSSASSEKMGLIEKTITL